jgi:pimeloyl-ACP methyl ester carboxylesterase
VESTIRTSDGRVLCVEQGGDLGGRPIVIHNGAPSSRLLFPPHVQRAAAMGVRLISYDRPGYGGSTAQHERRVCDAAADVGAIAHALGIERLGVWGFSSGGPHALACAALLPDLVAAVVVLASVGPEYLAGQDQESIDEVGLMRSDPATARATFDKERLELLHLTADDLGDSLRAQRPAIDEQTIGEFAAYRMATYQSGLGAGSDGWWDDIFAFLLPWGFDLATISPPVLLRHGHRDLSVPIEHAASLAHRLPQLRIEYTEDDHVSLFCRDRADDFSWLLHFLS